MEYFRKFKDFKQNAFTLAEVLITIGIIGVVAAMTLPSLNQRLKDQKNISTLKKRLEDLSFSFLL